ncbi:amino acid ABC transporter permease [Streptomyces sp. NPDC059578]|uniref:amino acid ABC transporter permease n=1 Tax=unclassified Streptomyces TaxID=2593676 RepID=UPI0036561494
MRPDTATRSGHEIRAVSPRRDTSGSAILIGTLVWLFTVVFTGWTALGLPEIASGGWKGLIAIALWLMVALALVAGLPLLRGLRYRREAARAQAADDHPAVRAARSHASRSGWLAAGWSLPLIAVTVFAQFLAANDHSVQSTFFDVEFMARSFQDILIGFWVNVRIAVVAQILILFWALLIALAKLAPGRGGRPIRWIATTYIDIFRAVPSIVVIYLIGFGLPLAQVPFFSDLGPFWSAVLALTLIYGAYVAEVYRSGIEGVHWSQVAAARSLGLSYGKTMRFVVLPQAVRRVLPPLLNDFIGLQKDTALVTIIGTVEVFTQAKIYAGNYFNLSSVTVVAIIFIIITIPQTRFVDRLIERDSRAKTRS